MGTGSYRLKGILGVFALLLAACGGGGSADTTEAAPDTTAVPSTTAPAATSPLAGQWERAESSFSSLDGMIIEVDADGTSAVIVTVPENEFQFVVGDEKWRAIESTSDTEANFEDMVREEGSGSESYVEGIITLSDDGNTLTVTFPTTGTTQDWVRVEDS